MNVSGLVIGEDVATAMCGALNAGYFGNYWWRKQGRRSRRMGAAALTLLSGATVVEALFSQELFWSEQGFAVVPNGFWPLLRLPLLIATLFVSAIIMRRLARP